MIGLLRADWRKLLHRWMPRILIFILLALTALVFFGISSRGRNRGYLVLPDGLVVALSLAASFAAFIWPILAGSWSGGEYGWGTVRLALTRRPSRIEFTLSGLIVILITVGVGLVLVLITGAVAGSLVAAATHASVTPAPPGTSTTAEIVKLFFAVWYTSAFYAVLAYTAGAVFRSAPAGIGIGIGFAVAQGAVSAIFGALGDPWKSIALHFPDAYTTALTSRLAHEILTGELGGRVSSDAASIPVSLVGIAVYLAILITAMLTVVTRRDVTA
jgi:hypothetical protein